MGILVLFLLLAAWGLVLAPALLGNGKDPVESEKVFRRTLRAIGGTVKPRPVSSGRWILVPKIAAPPVASARTRATERRLTNLTILAAFVLVTFLLGFLRPLRFCLWVSLVSNAFFVVYLAAHIAVTRRRRTQQSAPARLYAARTPPEAAV